MTDQRELTNTEQLDLDEYRDFESSCAKCFHASWEHYFDGETRDTNIGCNYPSKGNLEPANDRDEIIEHWHDDTVDHSLDCGQYLHFQSSTTPIEQPQS